ncbi:MAG: MBG domain-containing protein, partial [Bacteroidota bacterium]
YFLHYIHTDLARNNSNRISSGSFTTDDLDNYTQVINAVSVGIPDFTWTLNGTISELNDHPTTSSGSIGYAANIVPGIAGQSWQSNGAAHINPENSDLINSDPSTVSRSVSLWFESTNPVGWQNIYEEGGSTHGWHIGLYDDYLTLSITQNSSVRNSIQFQIAANTVYHVAATFDLADQSSGDNMHLYVNGAEVGASNFTTQNFLNSHTGDIQFGEISDGIALGSDQGSKTKVNFAGRIQRIDYWSEEELSAQDVEDIYILGGDVTLTAPTDIELNNNSVEEGTASGTKIGDLTADGTVPITFSLVSGSGDADNGKFSIVNRELRISEVPNFSTQSSYSVRISAENAAGSVSEVFTIGVTEAVINSPTSLLLSNLIVLDETTAGASIGTFTTDGDEPVYTLVTGAGDEDNSAFSINADELVISETVDFSTQSSYSIRARVSNSEGAFERAFTLEVVIVPSEINLSTTDIEDETSEDDVVSTLSTNGSGAITFALTGGSGSDDNNSFTVSGNQLIVEEFVDFSVKSSYRIRLSATNDGGTYAEAFQLNVLEPRFAPDNLELNSSIILDGLAAGSEITTISADGTDPLVFSLASGAGDTNNASFSVISNQLFIEENVDIDIKNTFSIRLEASNSEGSTESAFTLDVVRAPSTLTLSNDEIEDGTASGSLVAILNSDGSAPISYSLIGGAGSGDNSAFSISGNQLIIQETVNFASKSSYSIQLRVANVGGILDRNFVLNVFEPLASPTDLDLSTSTLLDGTVSNSEIATISARGTAPIEFTLVAGAGDQDNASFSINEDQLSILETADFIAKPSYSIRIAATNDLGSIEDSFTLTVLGEKVTLTVTANNMSSNYGREVPPLTFGYRGFIDGDGPSALDAEPAASTNATLQSTPGDYTISISGGASEKYDFEYVSGILDVQKAALNVSVQDVEIEQGESIPSFLLSYEGFRNEETATDLPSQPQASTSANSSSSPGNYPILLTGGSSNNYSFVYEEGTLTILEACALDISLTFDELDSIINVNISGGVAPYNISWNTGATSESIKIDRFGPYSVTVEDARSCDAETTLFITQNSFNVLGLEDASRLEFWPNPTTAMLHLKSDKVIGRVQIFSLAGQLVFQKEINSKTQTLNIGEIKSGTYLLTLNNDFDGVTRILLKN